MSGRWVRIVPDGDAMTPRDLLLAGLDRYAQHEVTCDVVLWALALKPPDCTCGLAQWRAQVIALIEHVERLYAEDAKFCDMLDQRTAELRAAVDRLHARLER